MLKRAIAVIVCANLWSGPWDRWTQFQRVQAAGQPASGLNSPSHGALLGRIRQHMQQRLIEVPNYTCQETIERLRRPRNARQFEEIDTVRLEVAQVGRTEMLAWPGDRFEVKPLAAFVPSGLMSNGTFVMHARNLFTRDVATFRHGGGRNLIRFDYRVPSERSGYRIRSFGQSAIVAYRGSFWADPGSLDVLRLEVYVDSIPRNLQMTKAETVIEYQRIQIGSAEALLPKTAELTVTRTTRAQERNRITFSGCRQYGSESMITYEAPRVQELPASAESPAVTVQAGLRLRLVLETPLDPGRTAIGSPVEASVGEDVTDGTQVVIPRGAKASGRVRSVRRIGKPMQLMEVGLEFTAARWNGGQARLHIGTEDGGGNRIGTLYLKAPEFKATGLEMVWETLAPAEP